MTKAPRILLTDDHPILLEAMRLTLLSIEAGCEVDTASTLQGATCAAAAHDYDYAILDLGLPDVNGLPVVSEFKRAAPDVPVVVFSATTDRESILGALDAGAMGFIPKTAPSEVVVNALKLVFSGTIYIPPEALLEDSCASAAPQPSLELTPRQTDVMHMLLRGLSNKHICRELNIAENTVKVHMTAVLRAFGASNRTQAVLKAAAMGIKLPVGNDRERPTAGAGFTDTAARGPLHVRR